MSKHYVLEERDGERWLVVTAAWSDRVAEALRAGLADRLDLNYARGFSTQSLEFLGEVRALRALHVLDRTVVDLDPVYELADTLEVLSIQAAPSAELDLGQLPHLHEIAGTWDLIGPTLGRSLGLRTVTTWKYGAPDLRDFRDHVELERLTVKDAPRLTSLSGIADLPVLSSLKALGVPRLHDIEDVGALGVSLREFELERCHRIEHIEAVESLVKLRFLGVSDAGTIATLAPLRNLHDLEVIHAWGTTKIEDDDLSPLSALPNLRELRMRERRTYRRPSGSFMQPSAGSHKSALSILRVARVRLFRPQLDGYACVANR